MNITIEQLKRQAEILTKETGKGHSQCLDIASKLNGFKDYHHLQKTTEGKKLAKQLDSHNISSSIMHILPEDILKATDYMKNKFDLVKEMEDRIEAELVREIEDSNFSVIEGNLFYKNFALTPYLWPVYISKACLALVKNDDFYDEEKDEYIEMDLYRLYLFTPIIGQDHREFSYFLQFKSWEEAESFLENPDQCDVKSNQIFEQYISDKFKFGWFVNSEKLKKGTEGVYQITLNVPAVAEAVLNIQAKNHGDAVNKARQAILTNHNLIIDDHEEWEVSYLTGDDEDTSITDSVKIINSYASHIEGDDCEVQDDCDGLG